MSVTLKITERDRGYNKLLRDLSALNGLSLSVGIPAKEGAAKYPNGRTVAEVAAWLHNGTSRIPARPFLDWTFEPNEKKIREMQRRVTIEIVAGRLTPEKGLNLLGLALAGMVKKTIEAGIPPELVSREGVPLIDTGQLIGSIKHEVVKT